MIIRRTSAAAAFSAASRIVQRRLRPFSLLSLHTASAHTLRSTRPNVCIATAAATAAAAAISSSAHIRRFHSSTLVHAFSYPTPRTLNEIVKLPLLLPLEREEIERIWRAHDFAS